MTQERILLVDDEPEVLNALSLRLRTKFEVEVCSCPIKALEMIIEKGEYPVILSNLSMPGMNGIEFLQEVQKLSPTTSTILLTGQGEYGTAVDALNSGVIFKYLVKPCQNEDVQEALQEGLREHHSKVAELAALVNYNKENDVAEILQEQLVFSHNSFGPSVDFAVHATAQRKVSGDFYEVIPHKNECYDVILADVMGKGLSAALIGAAAKNVIHQQINILLKEKEGQSLPLISEITSRVGRELASKLQQTKAFITLFYLRLNLKNGVVSYVNCGHPGALLLKDEGATVLQLKSSDVPLGVIKDVEYEEKVFHANRGDKIVIFSDGITDALNDSNSTDTSSLVMSCLSGDEESSQTVVDNILQQAKSKCHSQDDMTLISIILKWAHTKRGEASIKLRRDMDEVFRLNKFLNKNLIKEGDLFKLAAIEAFTNILKYTGRDDPTIEVSVCQAADSCRQVSFVYSGPQFQPNEIKLPDCSQQVNGFGLYLLEKICQNVHYSVLENGLNCICLTAKKEE